MNTFRFFAVIAIFAMFASYSSAQSNYTLTSPDGHIEVKIRATDRIRYDVSYKGQPVLHDAEIARDVEHKNLGANPRVTGTKQRSEDKILEPVVCQKFARI